MQNYNKNSKVSADKTLMYLFVWSDAKQHSWVKHQCQNENLLLFRVIKIKCFVYQINFFACLVENECNSSQ